MSKEILRFVDETEQAYGPLAYEHLDPYRAHYTRRCDHDSRLLTEAALIDLERLADGQQP